MGPDDFPVLTNGPFYGAQVTVETRRDSHRRCARRELRDSTGATQMPDRFDRAGGDRRRSGSAGHVRRDGRRPAGLFPTYDWAFGNVTGESMGTSGRRAHVIRLGPSVPDRLVVASVATGRNTVSATFTGNIRPLSDRDAALFGTPNGVRLDPAGTDADGP